jgi:hypothetical protein
MITLAPVARDLVALAGSWTRGHVIAGLWQHRSFQPELCFVAAERRGHVCFFDVFGQSVPARDARGIEIAIGEALEVAI